MAAKKFYAVKKGYTTGIFTAWADCKASVDGYPGAEYKGFQTLDEAQTYMGQPQERNQAKTQPQDRNRNQAKTQLQDRAKTQPQDQTPGLLQADTLLAYVDGSYNHSLQKYAFGCVFLPADGRIYTAFGNGDNPDSLQHRNVTGEMLGAMYAVKTAIFNGYSGIEIRYDYQGIEKWVTGEWRSKTELTQKYAAAMRNWSRQITITFTKVAAHTNVTYNELADQMAKKGLTEGKGIPKIVKLEELTRYSQA